MIAVSYDDVTFSGLDIDARIIRALPGPDRQAISQDRVGAPPIITGMTHGLRTIVVTFYPKLQQQAETRLLTLLKNLDPSNDTPRVLAAKLDLNSDDTAETEVEIDAVIGQWQWADSDGKGLVVPFITADPYWRETADSSETGTGGLGDVYALNLDLTNAGQATVAPVITFAPDVHGSTQSAFNRRQVTVTNAGTTTINRWPYRLDLGDTSDWSFFNNVLSEVEERDAEFYVWRDGQQVPRFPVNLMGAQSYCWIVLDDLGPGETVTYDLTYHGAATSTGPLDFSLADAPVPDINFEAAASTAATTTTVTLSTATWATNQYRDGELHILSGSAAGQSSRIDSNTGTVLTVATAFTVSPGVGADFLITMSANDRFVYATSQRERSDRRRGLWTTNGFGQSRPSIIRYDAPGSWYLYSYLDNDDVRAQKEITPIVIGSTADYFAILNAGRSWPGAIPFEKGSPVHDGVAFSSPIPITRWTFDYQFQNPNGICEAFFGCREAGGSGWTPLHTDTDAHSTLTTVAAADYDPPSVITATELVAALLPRDETSIPDTWRVDSGTWSSGGLSTFGDETKTEWVSGQWDDAVILITSGAGQGQQSTVTGTSGGQDTLLNVSPSWTTQPDSSSRYQIVNKPLTANLRCGDRFRIDFDDSDLTHVVGDEFENFAGGQVFILDGPTAPYQQIRVGITDRHLFLSAGEALQLDGPNRRARVVDASDGSLIRELAGGYVSVESVAADSTVRLRNDWLALSPGAHNISTVSGPVGGDYTVAWREAYVG